MNDLSPDRKANNTVVVQTACLRSSSPVLESWKTLESCGPSVCVGVLKE